MSSCPASYEGFVKEASRFISCEDRPRWKIDTFDDTMREASGIICSPIRTSCCPPWFCQLVIWIPLVLIGLGLLSGLMFSYIWGLTKATDIPEDDALISLNALSDSSLVFLVPNVNTNLVFAPSQVATGITSYSTTSDATKFQVTGQARGPETLIYTPPFTAANGRRVKLSGTASTIITWIETSIPSSMYCGLAWQSGAGPVNTISEVLANSTTSFLSFVMWLTIPFTVTFTAAQVPSGSVSLFLYIRSPDGVLYQPTSISIQATEVI